MQAGTSSFVHGQAHAAQSKVERLLLEVLGFIENQTLCDMVNTVFWSCRRSNAQPEEIVDELYDKLCEIGVTGQRPILSAVVRFHAENSNLEKACDVYEEQAKQRSLFGEGGLVCNLGFHQQIVDMRCERILIDAATKCGRREIVVNLLCCSLCEATRYTSLVRTCATRGDLSVSMNAFKEIHSSGFKLPQHLWNVALSACAELNQIDRVEALIKQMEDDGVADGVTYNTMIKMYMQRDDHVRARGVFAIMQEAGFPPDIITYNEILHGYVKGIARGRNDSSVVWEVISEMSHAGVQPSRVTCSILLRNLKGEDLVRAMDLMESIGEPVDEGLLSAFLEACVRSGRADLISKKLHGLHAEGLVKITSPQAYGSLIKAYGVVKDVDGAWRCWREMLSQHLKPTSVTMGCMIEAVSANGDVDGAYEIVCSLLDDPQTRDQVNCIMFGSVLKGYGRMGRIDRVLEVFGDMLGRGIAPSLSSYNSVIDSCARGEQMCLVPGFIDDMRARGLQPDIITYSAAIKGHSMQGQMSRAIETLVQLRSEPSIKPDEILYNTLIDGCCHARLFDEGEKLFEEMLADGLTPNNYTIACMVRLFGIGRHLSKAFAIFEAGISKYHLRPSGQVYTALIIACAVSKEVDRAVSTYERSVRERAWPAVKACHALIRALLSAGYFVKAVELLRCMLGIAGVYTDDGIIPANPAFISNVLYQLRAESAEGRALAASLSADLQCLPTVPSTDGSGCGGKGRSGYASKGKYVNCKSGSSGAENWRKGR
jgi:pentatricopeptide repeat protein